MNASLNELAYALSLTAKTIRESGMVIGYSLKGLYSAIQNIE